jgi:PKD repeat protein
MFRLRQFLGWASVLVAGLTVGCNPDTGPSPTSIEGPSFSLVPTTGTEFWTAKAPMPTPRNFLGVAAINGILYAVGGANNGAEAVVEAYDPATDSWTTKTPMPTARYGVGVAPINGILYAVGGYNNGWLTTVEAYNPATDTWTTKAPMSVARNGLGMAVINGILYAVGGFGNGFKGTLEAYDPAEDTWTTKASMPTVRLLLGVAAINGVLYAVGGQGSDNGPVAVVEAYDPATDTWTTKASMPTARFGLGLAAINGILFAVGGNSGTTVEMYDPATDTWTTKPSMLTAQTDLGVAAINGILYAVGGDGPLATNEAFTPQPSSCVSPPSGLVGWWPGEGNANDIVGGNNGNLVGGVTFGTGEVGLGFLMDGRQAAGGVDVGNAPSLHFTGGDFTLETWVRFDAALYDRAILSKMISTGGVPNTDGWALIKQDNNHFWFCFGGGATNGCGPAEFTVFSATAVAPNVWYHIAVVKTSSDFALFVNGVEEDRRSLPLFANTDATDLLIGGGAQFLLNGKIDEPSIYNRALASTEIQAMYTAGSAGKCVPPPVQPPVPSTGGPYLDAEGAAVPFDASGSSDPQGQPLSYDWDFGDGSPHGTGVNPTHAYADDGSYAVTLVVSNTSKSSTASTTATISNAPPIVDAGADENRFTGQPFALSASFTDAGVSDAPWATSIDWGDGSPVMQGTTGAPGAISGSHTYGLPGAFTITVQVTDKDGGNGSDVAVVTVPNRTPVASVGGPYAGNEGATITFNGTGSSDPDGTSLTYSWDFGDGSAPATGPMPSHLYADNGAYTVSLTVSDGQLTSSATTTASLQNVAPTATFNHPGTTKEGSKLTMSLSSPFDPSSVDQAAGFTYAFDCGSGYGAFSTSNSLSCPTVDNGSIPIRAQLRDKDGGVTEYTASQTVTNVAPSVELHSLTSGKVRVGGTFSVGGSFNDAGIQDAPWSEVISWGDGTSTTLIATVQGSLFPQNHVYAAAGTYQVRMKVTDKDGGTGTSSPVTVKVQ